MKLKDLKSTKNYQKQKDNLFTICIVDEFIVHDLLYESSFLLCVVVLANASMISLFYLFSRISLLHDLLIVLSGEQIVTTSNSNRPILYIAVKFGGDDKCRTPLYAGCHVSFLLSNKFE